MWPFASVPTRPMRAVRMPSRESATASLAPLPPGICLNSPITLASCVGQLVVAEALTSMLIAPKTTARHSRRGVVSLGVVPGLVIGVAMESSRMARLMDSAGAGAGACVCTGGDLYEMVAVAGL